MSENPLFTLLVIAVVAAATFLTRMLPFAVFGGKKVPPFVVYLGNTLPVAIIAILVVYCFRHVNLIEYPYGLPELIAAAVVLWLHVWRRNVLISIFSGTAAYMVLIQVVF